MILTVFPDPRGNSLPQTDRACPATCAGCPFAKDRDLGLGRLHCTHNDQVVREHWKPTGDCLEALAKRQARQMQPSTARTNLLYISTKRRHQTKQRSKPKHLTVKRSPR